ncbi:MAG: MBL fold metallo-hydrolase [Candidatus Delongbacteria bacterium]|nr:MBL fold metallo-hydrolase [Candidatus Delongbacteria bacterium]
MKISILSSGSDGNSTLIQSPGGSILIDSGLSGKRLMERLDAVEADVQSIMSIIITHDHRDHIDGAGIIARKLKIPVYIHEDNFHTSEAKFEKCEIKFIGNEFTIGDFTILPFPVSHDGTANFAYSIISGGKKISDLREIGVITGMVKHRIKDSDLLVLESNHDLKMLHDGHYPWYLKQRIAGNRGHLSNLSAGNLISELNDFRLKNLILAHLSKENNDPNLALDCMTAIKEANDLTFNIHLAYQHKAIEFIEV